MYMCHLYMCMCVCIQYTYTNKNINTQINKIIKEKNIENINIYGYKK